MSKGKSAASKIINDVTLGIFKFGGITVQTKQFIGIALIIIGLLAFVFVMTLPHSHYNPEKESTTAKATKPKATTASATKPKAKKEKEETGSAPPTPKSARKKAAPKAAEESPVASKTRARGILFYKINFIFIIINIKLYL